MVLILTTLTNIIMNKNSRLDSSFMYADVEMTDRQTEIVKDEEQVSQKMTSKVYKTLASSLMRIFNRNRLYGCK